MRKKKIGYLGGTFDPIHFGHLNLAIEVQEKKQLDEIWFCPTSVSPHKIDTPPVSIEHRLKMISMGIEGHSSFKLIKNEAYTSKAPYTYETLKDLQQDPQHQDKDFFLILSEDLLPSFHLWFKVEDLLREFKLIVTNRKISNYPLFNKLKKELQPIIERQMLQIRTLEISSRDLRERLKNNLYCSHLAPLKVLDYIYQNKLY